MSATDGRIILEPERYEEEATKALHGSPAEGSRATVMRVALAMAQAVALERAQLASARRVALVLRNHVETLRVKLITRLDALRSFVESET